MPPVAGIQSAIFYLLFAIPGELSASSAVTFLPILAILAKSVLFFIQTCRIKHSPVWLPIKIRRLHRLWTTVNYRLRESKYLVSLLCVPELRPKLKTKSV